ncbi:MAG: histidine kinase [Burkholderiales bacterium]
MSTPVITAAPSWLPAGSILAAMGSFRWRLVFVVAFCAVVATEVLSQPEVFEYWTIGAVLGGYLDLYVQCLGYAVMILLALTAIEPLLPRMPGIARPIAVAVAVLAGAVAGGIVDIVVQDLGFAYMSTSRFAGDTLRWAILAGVAVGIYAVQRRAAASASRLHEAALERVALDRQMLEARLQVMRAQIEPHFLFNTLANVKRLCQRDVPRGITMLDNLVQYLRAALPQLRGGATTLGQEADLVRAYLDVLQIRMGAYLAFSVDVPADLRSCSFPPMMLLTLAENAIKHGLASSPEAGRIDVAARLEGPDLVVDVADTGVGFGVAKTSGTGIGLANTRARLAALYGSGSELALRANEPRGVVATIRVPLGRALAA